MLYDNMVKERSSSVDLFDTEQELSIMVFEDGNHEVTLHDFEGECFFKKVGNGKECYRFQKCEYKGEFLVRAVTPSYVLMKKVLLGE